MDKSNLKKYRGVYLWWKADGSLENMKVYYSWISDFQLSEKYRVFSIYNPHTGNMVDQGFIPQGQDELNFIRSIVDPKNKDAAKIEWGEW